MKVTGYRTRILFQGDSITDGNRSRDQDLNHVMGHGYAYLIASRLGFEHPERGYNFLNRGNSGDRVVDLYARWREDALELQPDIISILVGVNDVGHDFYDPAVRKGVSAPRFAKVLRTLLEETRDALPAARLILCEPFILPVGAVQGRWVDWQPEIGLRQAIIKDMAAELGAIHVSLQAAFDAACTQESAEYWLWDGIHPTPAGHELIARQWLAANQECFVK